MDDIVFNKIAIIRNCLKRIEQDYLGHESEIEDDFMRQDAIGYSNSRWSFL